MLKLHANILKKDGNKEFAVLPYDEFIQVKEELSDYEDLKELRNAKNKEKKSPTISLNEAKKELGL